MAFIQRVFIEHLLDCLGPGDTAENEIKQCLCFYRNDMLIDKKKKIHKISGGHNVQKTNKAGYGSETM